MNNIKLNEITNEFERQFPEEAQGFKSRVVKKREANKELKTMCKLAYEANIPNTQLAEIMRIVVSNKEVENVASYITSVINRRVRDREKKTVKPTTVSISSEPSLELNLRLPADVFVKLQVLADKLNRPRDDFAAEILKAGVLGDQNIVTNDFE